MTTIIYKEISHGRFAKNLACHKSQTGTPYAGHRKDIYELFKEAIAE